MHVYFVTLKGIDGPMYHKVKAISAEMAKRAAIEYFASLDLYPVVVSVELIRQNR